MGLVKRDNNAHTYADYRSWSEDQRYELIDGLAYAMSPAPSVSHQELVLALARQIADRLDESDCRVFVAPIDVRLPKLAEADDAIDTVVQPDLVVVCNTEKVDVHGIRGAPDWIIEVISPGTASHDQIVKRSLYERHGVREYWLVHPIDKVLTIYRLESGAYGKPDIQELIGMARCEALPEMTIDWATATRRL
jgi:Uma2 family endonuclease